MSVEIPVVALAFGAVTPPQGDVLELRVHLGCTKEVSSFECLLQNFDKKYTVTNPVNVGDNCSISIGRGASCPLVLTGRVEEIEPESTPVESYIRVRGRCWGEKIFRRVVTKTYENQKGEAIVRDLIDYYVGLSHVRTNSALTSDAASGQKDCVVADGSIFTAGMLVKIEDNNAWEYNEVASVAGNTVTMVNNLVNTYTVAAAGKVWIDLIEKTDTTYTLLDHKDAKVFDIIKYIAESADKSGVLGFDFRIEWDGKFAFFPKNTKTSPINLSQKIEHSQYSKDIHRVRNKIMVYGAAEKPYPLDVDGQPWSDSLTEDLTKPDNYLQHDDGKWEPVTGNTNLYIETSTVHTGSKSVKLECTAYMYYMGIMFTFNVGKYVNCNLYPRLCFTLQEDSNHNKKITISLEDKDGNTCRQTLDVADYDEWQTYELGVGKRNQESWTMSVFNSGPFDWENLKKVRFDFHQLSSKHGVAFTDRMHFGGCRWSATEEDTGSQSSYGLRELVEVDEELHSDNECSLRGKALLDHLSQPAEFLTLRTTCLDYGNDHLLPGDKIHVTLPNENIDSDFRIISVEYRVTARDQTLEITLELGKEKPLLADYLYGLRSTTITVEKLMRTKAGLTGGGFVGGGGGGGGMVQHGNEWHDPDFLEVPGDTMTGPLIILAPPDATALSLGDDTHEGGDIIVYRDAVGGVGFKVDADAMQVGIGRDVLATTQLMLETPSTLRYGIFIDRMTNDYTGSLTNGSLLVYHDVSTGTQTSSMTSYALGFLLRNYRDVQATGITSIGIQGSAYDYGDYISDWWGATHTVEGVYATTRYQGEDATNLDNDLDVYGIHTVADSYPTVNKSAGTLTAENYGIWAKATTDPSITAGSFTAETYGAYVEGLGTTEGTQTVYGIYAKAGGGDTNWAGYFVGADVHVDENLDLDGHITFDTDDYLDYDRANDRHLFYIGGTVVGYVDSTGFHNGAPP